MLLDGARTLVFAGDSVTDCGRHHDERGLGDGWVRYVADALAEQLGTAAPRVVNSGNSGDRLVDLERRWSDDVLAHAPDVVSVLIGINDTWRRYDKGIDSPVDEFEERYDRLLASTAGARLVLVEPFALPVDDHIRGWADDLDPRRAAVRRLADRWSALLLPAHDVLLARATQVGAEALADDGVHPTALGHRTLADLWLDAALGRAEVSL